MGVFYSLHLSEFSFIAYLFGVNSYPVWTWKLTAMEFSIDSEEEWFSDQHEQMIDVCSWPWQHFSLSPTAMMLLFKWDLQFQSSVMLTNIWEPGERVWGLLAMWHLWVGKAQRADAEEGCGIQRPWLSRITVLSCSLWAECALAIDFASLSKISVSGTKSMGNVPLFCFNLSWRALHLIADQWIWLLPVS